MAKKKVQEEPVEEVNTGQQQTKKTPEEAMQRIVELQQQKKLIDEQKSVEQVQQNKAHDAEFSEFSDYNGQNDTVTNLGIIGTQEVEEAYKTLMQYKENKAELEQRLVDNESFWKMKHWEVLGRDDKKDKRIKPKSAWLVNTILNKHADAMDNFPEANILPRSKDDEETAKVLSEIIPVILEQNDYEKTYSDTQWYKMKNGTSVQGIFWNNDKNNGLGDIDIKKIDIMSLYWKSGISDIQDSPNVFQVTMMDKDEVKARFPEMQEATNVSTIDDSKLYYGEDVDTQNQVAVVDWYYKRRTQGIDEKGIPQMQTVVHFCEFCNGQVLYASENDPNYSEKGWFNHGQYPFVFDTLFPIEASVCGMGYIDLIADDQLYIDKLQQAILENAIVNSRPRYAVRNDGSMNEEEFLDISNPVVHFEGSLGDDAFKQIAGTPLNNIYETVYLQKVQEMKDTSGNTASSQGQASSVTTASGIASLQEAAGKLSRDASSASYRSYKQVIYQVIELIRQFYTEPRCFRIVGDMGESDYKTFDNTGLQPQQQGMIPDDMGGMIDLGERLPIMDIEVKPQKKSAYSKETQNQTALNLYNMGFFAPNNYQASLACLNMMEFDGVEKIRETVAQNGAAYEQQQMLAMLAGAAATGANDGTAQQGGTSVSSSNGSLTSQAATATRNSTAPR